MKYQSYQYQILRYVHDVVTGEFVNVGVVVYFPEQPNEFKAEFIIRYQRLSQFFPKEFQGKHLMQLFRSFEKHIEKLHQQVEQEKVTFKSINQLTRELIVPDDSSLQFTEVKQGLGLNADSALKHLMARYVQQYDDNHKPSPTDADAWKEVYREVFSRYELTSHLQKHTVQGFLAPVDFEYAWKNGSWHCFKPTSFQIQADYVQEKIHRIMGMVQDLNTANEEICLYLLTLLPEDNPQIQQLVNGYFGEHRFDMPHVKVRLVTQAEADTFGKELKQKMYAHQT